MGVAEGREWVRHSGLVAEAIDPKHGIFLDNRRDRWSFDGSTQSLDELAEGVSHQGYRVLGAVERTTDQRELLPGDSRWGVDLKSERAHAEVVQARRQSGVVRLAVDVELR